MAMSSNLNKYFAEREIPLDVVNRLQLNDIFPEYRDRLCVILEDLWVTSEEASDLRLKEVIHEWNRNILGLESKWKKRLRWLVMDVSNEEGSDVYRDAA